METVGGNRGYSGLLHEALDPARGPDMKEAFNVGFDLEPDDPELLAGKPFRSLNAWPKLVRFRETLLAYYGSCAALGARLHKTFAGDLGVELDFFADKFDRPMATLRLLRYPAATGNPIGAGAHTDYGNLTLLATDDVGGLEVRTRSEKWIEASALPGAFVVNIGDCLMRWTNDIYVSAPHRVTGSSTAAAGSASPSPSSTTPTLTRRSPSSPPASRRANVPDTRPCWRPTISSTGSTPASRRGSPPQALRSPEACALLDVALRALREIEAGASDAVSIAAVAPMEMRALWQRSPCSPIASTPCDPFRAISRETIRMPTLSSGFRVMFLTAVIAE